MTVDLPPRTDREVWLVCAFSRPGMTENVLANYRRQKHRACNLIIVANGDGMRGPLPLAAFSGGGSTSRYWYAWHRRDDGRDHTYPGCDYQLRQGPGVYDLGPWDPAVVEGERTVEGELMASRLSKCTDYTGA
jgi:hypothetical protein